MAFPSFSFSSFILFNNFISEYIIKEKKCTTRQHCHHEVAKTTQPDETWAAALSFVHVPRHDEPLTTLYVSLSVTRTHTNNVLMKGLLRLLARILPQVRGKGTRHVRLNEKGS